MEELSQPGLGDNRLYPSLGKPLVLFLLFSFSVRRKDLSGTQITRDCLGPEIMDNRSVCFAWSYLCASLLAQRIKHLPAIQETRVRSLGWEDPLEKEMTTHSSILGECLQCPGESHGRRSLTGYSPLGHKEFDFTYKLGTHQSPRRVKKHTDLSKTHHILNPHPASDYVI